MAYDAEDQSPQRLILQRARDRIAEGWCALNRLDTDGNVCLRGALSIGRGVHPELSIIGEQDDLARLMGFFDECDAMCFNDTHTQAEVVARFDEAIAKFDAAVAK